MFCIESNSTDPYYQLALEEYIFTHLDPFAEYCLLWQSRNTVYLSRSQNAAEEIDQTFVDTAGIRVARRLSGGEAVFLNGSNLAFTYITGKETDPDRIRARFADALQRALAELGIMTDRQGDTLTIGGKRFSDSSRFISHGRLIFHGYVRLDADAGKTRAALRAKAKADAATSINAHTPVRITFPAFRTLFKQQLFASEALPYILTAADREAVQVLLAEKYETWEWNYGVI